MTIEMNCPGCGRKLRVSDEHAGKQARCPLCNMIYSVPDETAAVSEPAVNRERWNLKTPEGQSYGPVTREVLERWVAEGRVSDDCQLLNESDGVWRNADEIFPVLRPLPKAVPIQPVFDNPVVGTGEDPRAGLATAPAAVRVVNAHRGGLILALAVLSWAIGCPIFGVMAWVMGTNDLRDMQSGIIDSRGSGLTQAGQIIGMIHVILSLIVLLVALFAMLVLGLIR